jgi:hypothetical protein
MGAGNQISTILGLSSELESTEMQEHYTFILKELAQKMKDPVFRAGYETTPVDRSTHPEMYVLEFYHELGVLAISGLVDKNALLMLELYRLPAVWERLEPSLAMLRRSIPNAYGGLNI